MSETPAPFHRLLRKLVRVNAYGPSMADLAAFKFAAGLEPAQLDSVEDIDPVALSRFFKRRGPAKARSLEQEKAKVAHGYLIEMTLVETHRTLSTGELSCELSFGASKRHEQASPFAEPDAWGASDEADLQGLRSQCAALAEAALMRQEIPSPQSSGASPRL